VTATDQSGVSWTARRTASSARFGLPADPRVYLIGRRRLGSGIEPFGSFRQLACVDQLLDGLQALDDGIGRSGGGGH
jgi:hypothetical protein